MSWITTLQREALGLLDLLLPECCPICDHPAVLKPDGFCSECLKQISPLPASHCPRCSLPFPGYSNAVHLCGRCSQKPPAFAGVIAAGLYQGALKSAIQRFKNDHRPILDRPLGHLLAETVQHSPFDRKPDFIVPVPLHRSRLRQRGFNQSLLLAKDLSRRCHMPLDKTLLCRTLATPPQQQLSAERRLHNLHGAMVTTRQLDGEHVLLIDDVLTTGATADACAKILLKAGAGQVSVVVLARAQRHLSPG